MWSYDPPDPGTSNGQADEVSIRCVNCQWSTRGGAIAAYLAGQKHGNETGHLLRFRGTVQRPNSDQKVAPDV